MHAVGGMTLPWSGRTGNGPITVFGQVVLAGGPGLNVNNVTVYLNGNLCQLTPNPNNQLQASWAYLSLTPITVPNWASMFNITISAYYNGTVMHMQGGGQANLNYPCIVYQVLPFTTPNTLDFVSTAGSCYNVNGTVYPVQPASPSGQIREINDNFTVIPPSPVSDVSRIVVGIIQTLTLKGGVVAGTASVAPGTCRLTYPTPGPPMWDGSADTACYYSANSFGVTPGTPCNPAYYSTSPLTVLDSPNTKFPSTTGGGATVYWPILNGVPGTAYTSEAFEDMMVASSNDFPGIVVPIYGYKLWTACTAGSYSPLLAQWSGTVPGLGVVGGVTSPGMSTLAPLTDPALGPANALAPPIFSIP